MKITRIDCHVLLEPGYDIGATSSAQDDIVVEIHTDEGLDRHRRERHQSLDRESLHRRAGHAHDGSRAGADADRRGPARRRGALGKALRRSAMNGRRGAVIHAMGALDMALHDCAAKRLGSPATSSSAAPCARRSSRSASLQPEVSSFPAYRRSLVDWALRAKALGLPCGEDRSDAHRAVRAQGPQGVARGHDSGHWRSPRGSGKDFTLMVDVQYTFPDANTCLRAIRAVGRFRLVLRRDAATFGRPGRLCEIERGTAHPDRGRRVARRRGTSSPI